MNELSIAVIIVITVSTIHGYRKGFIRIIITLISLILTIWLVSVVTPYITTYMMNHTDVYEKIKDHVEESFEEENSRRDNTIAENQIETINSYQIPSIVKNSLISNNNENVYGSLMVSAFEGYISGYIARMIINLMAFVCTFLMIYIFLKMTFLSMELIGKLPIIKGLNKLVGGVAGFAEGILLVWIGFLAATIFAGNEIGMKFFTLIDSSYFLSFLYNNNILFKWSVLI
ncbi:MAG: CvpA family protein [Lachnospiraceae bacterium]|nr:CvpA family protein [Lachnospiraceae bacterium]